MQKKVLFSQNFMSFYSPPPPQKKTNSLDRRYRILSLKNCFFLNKNLFSFYFFCNKKFMCKKTAVFVAKTNFHCIFRNIKIPIQTKVLFSHNFISLYPFLTKYNFGQHFAYFFLKKWFFRIQHRPSFNLFLN